MKTILQSILQRQAVLEGEFILPRITVTEGPKIDAHVLG